MPRWAGAALTATRGVSAGIVQAAGLMLLIGCVSQAYGMSQETWR